MVKTFKYFDLIIKQNLTNLLILSCLKTNQAQNEIFEGYFSLRNFAASNDSDYSNIKRNVEEKIALFENEETVAVNFQFASSNPLWRASLEKLNFAPLNNVDYAGGIIVTDWFSNENSNEEIKITIRFLTNEIRSDAINVIIHKKVCSAQNNCKITKIDKDLNFEIKFEILKKAAQIQNNDVALKVIKGKVESDDLAKIFK